MKIAVEGCSHGELDQIYAAIENIKITRNIEIELLICCGDFQAVRNRQDLMCMAVSPKWRNMKDFYKYYSGEKKAPVLTIFIGGNHEASNHLSELAFGGWVAPKIYYLGYAGVVNVNGIKIAGLSGIYKRYNYLKGHYEFPPYDNNTLRSAYHIRNIDVYRLAQVHGKVDICISHDWPAGIAWHGDTRRLFNQKRFLIDDIESNRLGSPPALGLLKHLKPKHWLSAHLHVKFLAEFRHEPTDNEDTGTGQVTKFMALDKCLPRRQYLEIIDVDTNTDHQGSSGKLCYDLEWLSILKATDDLFNVTPYVQTLPDHDVDIGLIEQHATEILKSFNNDLTIPDNFVIGPPPFTPRNAGGMVPTPMIHINPQTKSLCEKIGLTDPCVKFMQFHREQQNVSHEETGISGQDFVNETTEDQSSDPGTIAGSLSSGILRSSLNLTPVLGSTEVRSSLTNIVSEQVAPFRKISHNPDEIELDSDDNNTDDTAVDVTPSSGDGANSDSSDNKRHIQEKPTSGPIMMKRRNQAIYTMEEDD